MQAPGQGPQKPGLGTRSGRDNVLQRQMNQQVPLPGAGLAHTTLPGGVALHARSRRWVTTPLPFFAAVIGSLNDTKVRIWPGTYNGVPPTVGGDTLTTYRDMLLADGAQHLYIHPVYTLSSTEGGYVYSSELFSVDLALQSAVVPSPLGPSAGVFWVLVASFLNRVKTAQYVTSSLSGDVCDSGESEATGNLTLQQA